tara:strand:- start:3089 stop:3229 length:141 start_codon:yes stop_codon:yes gene_type:complete
MISSRELESVVAQINTKFEELFKKLATLEEDVKNANKNTVKGKSKG